jgi:hypothetical protein
MSLWRRRRPPFWRRHGAKLLDLALVLAAVVLLLELFFLLLR